MNGSIEFPYRMFRFRTLGLLPRPLIRLKIRGPALEMPGWFVLDSGSDVSFIPLSMGRLLGLSTAGAPRLQCKGVGRGRLAYFLCPAEFDIGGFRFSARVGWSTVEETPLVLGRLDVFDRFDIEFRQASNRIILRRASPGA